MILQEIATVSDDLPYWLRARVEELEKTYVPGPFAATDNPAPEDPDSEPESGWNCDAGKGLSSVQRDVLAYLWEETQRYEAHSDHFHREARVWGVRWRPNRIYLDLTPSNRAAISRSIRRMEERGLLYRLNHCTEGRRTTCVRLTPDGRHIAKRLSKSAVVNDNH